MKVFTNCKLAQNIWNKDLNNLSNLVPFDQQNLQGQNDQNIPKINNEDVINKYLLDDVENASQGTVETPESIQDPFLLGVTPDIEQIKYNNSSQLLIDGMNNKELVSFSYVTRSGKNIGVRVVEPHYTFMANTGNEVLVSFDRSVNDIRAFIVGNILSNGVRYKNVHFSVRPQIMR